MFESRAELLKAVEELSVRLQRLSKEFDREEFRRAIDDYAVLAQRLRTFIGEHEAAPDEDPQERSRSHQIPGGI